MVFEKNNSADTLKIQAKPEKTTDARLFGQKTEEQKGKKLESDQEKIHSEREAEKVLWDLDWPTKKIENARETTEKWAKIGPELLQTLLQNVPPERKQLVDKIRSYMEVSESNNPDQIKQFHISAGKNWCGPETAWCMSFVQHVLKEIGNKNYKPTAWARHWLSMGTPTQTPQPGDLLIVERWEGGHIGFFMGLSENGKPLIIGWNQWNGEVSLKEETRPILWYRSIA